MSAARPNRLAIVDDLEDADVACTGCARNIVRHLLQHQKHSASSAMNTLTLGLALVVAATRPPPEDVDAFLAALPGVLRAHLDDIAEQNREALREMPAAGRA